MLMVYNILHKNVGSPSNAFHKRPSSMTTGHDLKLFKPHAQKIVCSNFFIRLIDAWNQLPKLMK